MALDQLILIRCIFQCQQPTLESLAAVLGSMMSQASLAESVRHIVIDVSRSSISLVHIHIQESLSGIVYPRPLHEALNEKLFCESSATIVDIDLKVFCPCTLQRGLACSRMQVQGSCLFYHPHPIVQCAP